MVGDDTNEVDLEGTESRRPATTEIGWWERRRERNRARREPGAEVKSWWAMRRERKRESREPKDIELVEREIPSN